MKNYLIASLVLLTSSVCAQDGWKWIPDLGDGTYKNPVIHADYSDPDVVHVGTDFYMTSSSFNCVPGLPILHSKDLINWKIINHVFTQQPPLDVFEAPGHGNGVWAPSFRYHDGLYYIYYGDPDHGIYQATATDPAGEWTHELVHPALGWIDPCPLWDDDGNAYLVHAYANSRSGIKSVITVRKMSADGKTISTTDTVNIYDGRDAGELETIEGPKFYKRNNLYYVFAPYGGVANGSQAVLRSDSPMGEYTYEAPVLEQGSTDINGPHQGGWVELESGESWFLHFQELQPFGRVVHLNPVKWENDWPIMGDNREPVRTYTKPNVGQTYPVVIPETSDDFESNELGLQWQWHANYDESWWSLENGSLTLHTQEVPADFEDNFWAVPNLLMQKIPSPEFAVVTKMSINLSNVGDVAGVINMGRSYSYLAIMKTDTGNVLVQTRNQSADGSGKDQIRGAVKYDGSEIYLRISLNGDRCGYAYSADGVNYQALGALNTVREGIWIGSKIGLFAVANGPSTTQLPSSVSFDAFTFENYFTAAPQKPSNPEPAVGEYIGNKSNQILRWENDPINSDSVFVYAGTDVNQMELLLASQGSVASTIRNLVSGETYYWRVDSKNEHGMTSGDVWHFTVGDLLANDYLINSPKLYPNPFHDFTTLEIGLRASSDVSVQVYSIEGKVLKSDKYQKLPKGIHHLQVNRNELNAGLYILKLYVNGVEAMEKKLVVE